MVWEVDIKDYLETLDTEKIEDMLTELYEEYKLYKRRKDVKSSVQNSVGDGMDKKIYFFDFSQK